jgi:hypothetical protein
MTIATWLPWLLIIIGWLATHLFSEARERRKEVRAQLDKIQERLVKIEVDARKFHTAEKFEHETAYVISSAIYRNEAALRRLEILGPGSLNEILSEHRKAVTLRNFDKSTFVRQALNCQLLSDINYWTLELEDGIEELYRQRYPVTFPYFKPVWRSLAF